MKEIVTMEEVIDREKEKKLVIHNIPESTLDQNQERQEADLQAVNDELDTHNVKIARSIRLGEKNQNKRVKPESY